MNVIAIQRGFFGGILREKGEVFEVPDGTNAPWFAPKPGLVAAAPEEAQAPASAEKPKAKASTKAKAEAPPAPAS
jgi:hypothetical protein